MKKELILEKAGEIFLKYGFKSVTMDDVAQQLAISKKTIYKYFNNKKTLVDETVSRFHIKIHNEIAEACTKGYNAIEENFEIKKKFKDLLNNSNESPLFQLQKYYPETFKKVMHYEFLMFKDCISANIEKGISEGLYLKDIDKELMTNFYFTLIMGLHDSNIYPYTKYPHNKLEYDALAYHTRAIATTKGIQILEEQLAQI